MTTLSPKGTKKVILCVDDEESILKSLWRALSLEGYQVLMANSGDAGLDILGKETVDLIIVDQRMPNMSGAEFLKEVKNRFPGMASIMLTGYSDPTSLESAVKEGEVRCLLAKPWTKEELLQAIESSIK